MVSGSFLKQARKWLCALVVLVIIVILVQVEITELHISAQVIGLKRWYFWSKTVKFTPKSPSELSSVQDIDKPNEPYGLGNNSVAVGMGITFRGRTGQMAKQGLNRIQLFSHLMPSFCRTASSGYKYHFYFSYDFNDPFLSVKSNTQQFKDQFYQTYKEHCKGEIMVDVHLVMLPHSGKPAWAQNDVMMQAYIDGSEYFYRINDDTVMKSPGWTEAFIKQLESYSPPKVGVTGPMHHGGNEAILTYDFTHRTHMEVFGFYYPRLMTDWYADRWITDVYKPGRSTKLNVIQLLHTLADGTRYHVNPHVGAQVVDKINKDKLILNRYLKYKEAKDQIVADGKRVISMSLYGNDTKYTYGAIRNAQLLPVMFPGWKLRVYLEKPGPNMQYPQVPEQIVKLLRHLGVQVYQIDASSVKVPPLMWRFLIADDLNVEYFIVRDAQSRLTDRDFTVVSDWIKQGHAFHCIRDQPRHSVMAVPGGLWGGKPKELTKNLKQKWSDLMKSFQNGDAADVKFLESVIWPKVQDSTFCHDSVSCQKYNSSHPMIVPRQGSEHFGQVFDGFGEPRSAEAKNILKAKFPPECTKLSQ